MPLCIGIEGWYIRTCLPSFFCNSKEGGKAGREGPNHQKKCLVYLAGAGHVVLTRTATTCGSAELMVK